MSAEDWIEDHDPCDDGQPSLTECKFCGKAGLHWEELEPGKWRLFDEHRMHRCEQTRVIRFAAADFEDLDR